MGSDPASVAFDTLSSAVANNADVVIIDTAGRLHNKVGLMNELTKIKNVMKKVVADAPHEVLLVLDGSTGQNAFEQAKQFTLATEVTIWQLPNWTEQPKGRCNWHLRAVQDSRKIYWIGQKALKTCRYSAKKNL